MPVKNTNFPVWPTYNTDDWYAGDRNMPNTADAAAVEDFLLAAAKFAESNRQEGDKKTFIVTHTRKIIGFKPFPINPA